MDVTSLLNVSCVVGGRLQGGLQGGLPTGLQTGFEGALQGAPRGQCRRTGSIASSTPSATGETTANSTAVPNTPSPPGSRATSRRSGSTSPSESVTVTNHRNRTPWDAGGYSLPLSLSIDTKSIPTGGEYGRPTCQSPPASPSSPAGHKFSLSRSSLSSFTSATTNASDISQTSSLFSRHPNRSDSLAAINYQYYQPSHIRSPPNHRNMASEQVDLTHMSDDEDIQASPPVKLEHNSDSYRQAASIGANGFNNNTTPFHHQELALRPQSPSDIAMPLPRRGHSNSNASLNSSSDIAPYVNHEDANSRHQSDEPKVLRDTVGRFWVGGELWNFLDQKMCLDYQECLRMLDIDQPPACSVMTPCTLPDSQVNMRKSMSHIFGRNKSCTRAIPDHVWLMVCRKHYQRARYRSDMNYQSTLLQRIMIQVARIQVWSNDNERSGKEGILKDWTVAVRRREAKRIDDVGKDKRKGSKKRSRAEVEAEEDEMDDADEPDLDAAIHQASSVPVPDWYQELCRDGYETLKVLEILAHIDKDMDAGVLSAVPDIELLPNIEGAHTAKKAKTKTSTAHRRTQSSGAALRRPLPRSAAAPRRASQPAINASPEQVFQRPPRSDFTFEAPVATYPPVPRDSEAMSRTYDSPSTLEPTVPRSTPQYESRSSRSSQVPMPTYNTQQYESRTNRTVPAYSNTGSHGRSDVYSTDTFGRRSGHQRSVSDAHFSQLPTSNYSQGYSNPNTYTGYPVPTSGYSIPPVYSNNSYASYQSVPAPMNNFGPTGSDFRPSNDEYRSNEYGSYAYNQRNQYPTSGPAFGGSPIKHVRNHSSPVFGMMGYTSTVTGQTVPATTSAYSGPEARWPTYQAPTIPAMSGANNVLPDPRRGSANVLGSPFGSSQPAVPARRESMVSSQHSSQDEEGYGAPGSVAGSTGSRQ
ncbi:hypothetical protein QBC40DRAFT_60070 [Triangularia verruculosa]|uniref:Uncharacterized protein n=1 Tax=Triangularia verruculosa TaxID=2587418 RepID=A0AAN6XMY5_9PEZI|nr:hypothetical protein QBC40DRAFT_60070 [Triangularia verruculosa]